MSTIFKKIIDKELPADIVYEDDICMAFKDINPAAPVHLLVIPKKEIPALRDLTEADKEIMGHLMVKTAEIAEAAGLKEDGYRVITNIGKNGGQEVPHLHFHILGGQPVGRLVV